MDPTKKEITTSTSTPTEIKTCTICNNTEPFWFGKCWQCISNAQYEKSKLNRTEKVTFGFGQEFDVYLPRCQNFPSSLLGKI